jgi:uncharacterized protein YcnI
MRAVVMAAVMLVAASTAVAYAHVTVWPRESQAGAGERYTVRVPTEGQVATVAVELEVPVDVAITGVLTGPAYETRREGTRVVAITWKQEIKPGEVGEFVFFARNPKVSQIAWKAHQRFADGTSADWVGVEGDRRPASVTRLTTAR